MKGALTNQRAFAALIAIIGWSALVLQLGLTLSAVMAQGRSAAAGIWLYLGYFTILTNILVATTMTLVAFNRWPGGAKPNAGAMTGVALAIGVVGVVYHLLLSGKVPELTSFGWLADRTMHYLVPMLTLLFWVACVPKSGLTYTDPFRWIIYPVCYLAYAMVRGSFDGWYPYFFIDVSALGYQKAMLNAAVLSVGVLIIGFFIVFVSRMLHARTNTN